MNLKNEKTYLRRVFLTNRFDRAFNFVLIRVYPLLPNQDEHIISCYEALKYADAKLKSEKEILAKAKKIILKNRKNPDGIHVAKMLLENVENEQLERHQVMRKMIQRR